ncbi:hypothetical protein ACRAWF_04530 [Streptomyces sp. L7]
MATELERASERSRDRGDWTGSSMLLARAASLTPGLPTRARRLLGAAEASAVAGSPGRAQTLLDEAAAYREDRHHNGLVQRVQARVHRLTGAPAAADPCPAGGGSTGGSRRRPARSRHPRGSARPGADQRLAGA